MYNVLRWLIFGAIVSLLPLGFTYLALLIRSQPVQWTSLIGNGELLVITWVLSASAFGELYGSERANKYLKLFFGGITFVIVLFSAMFFASIVEANAANEVLDEHVVIQSSLWVFVVSLIPCCCCLACIGD